MPKDFVSAYQWDLRPQLHGMPAWFKAWPRGARLAFQIIVLHEWAAGPRHQGHPMPAESLHKLDFLGLGIREYGARHGIWRLLDVLDRHDVKATVLASGLVGELFPQSVRDARERGHEIASHRWDQAIHPPVFKSRVEEQAALARTPPFAKLLDDLLAYVSRFNQVWFARCIDIADFWTENTQSA